MCLLACGLVLGHCCVSFVWVMIVDWWYCRNLLVLVCGFGWLVILCLRVWLAVLGAEG